MPGIRIENQCPEQLRNHLELQLHFAPERFEQIQDILLTQYGWLELEPFRAQISMAIVAGLWIPAVTATNMLLEQVLKVALMYRNRAELSATDSFEDFAASFEKSAEMYGISDLEQNINKACSQNLIDKQTKLRLREFQRVFRNGYGHADISRIVGDRSMRISALTSNADGDLVEVESNQPVWKLPFAYGGIVFEHARENAIPYFREVDTLVRCLKQTVFPLESETDEIEMTLGADGMLD